MVEFVLYLEVSILSWSSNYNIYEHQNIMFLF